MSGTGSRSISRTGTPISLPGCPGARGVSSRNPVAPGPAPLACSYQSLQIAIDLFFFIIFLGAKLVGRSGTREVAMMVMADIVDLIELTFSMTGGPTASGAR